MKGRQTADIPKGKSDLVLKTAAVAIVAMLAVVCLAFLNIDSSSADPDSGECGDNVTWAYDGDHTLTISGTGEMTDYNYTPPWYNYRGSITDLVIGDGVTTIGNGAFNCLFNLENVTIGSSVTSIGSRAFNGANFTELVIPNSVVSIGESAFSYSEITDLTLGSGLQTIGKSAFTNTKITSLTLPDSLVSIEEGAFAGNNITALVLPDSVTEVGDRAFAGTHIAALTVGSGLETIGKQAFDAEELATITIDGSNPYYMADDNIIFSKDGTQVILYPAGLTATALAFDDAVTEIVNTIRNYNIESIAISKYLVKLCDNPFDVPQAAIITVDGENPAFTIANNCLMSADGKKLIKHFSSASGTFTVPDGVESIEPYAFYNHQAMSAVVLPASVTEVKDNAFNYCTGLETVTGGSVTAVGDDAFRSCNNLQSFPFGEGVTYVGEGAFSNSRLASVTISGADGSVIGESAFSGCQYLGAITLTGGLSIGYGAFYGSASIVDECTLTLGSGITSIGANAFYGANISTITIPDTVVSIGTGAFSGCNVVDKDTTVTIGTGVTTIDSSAFSGCDIVTMNYNAIDCSNFSTYYVFGWSQEAEEITIVFGESVQTIPGHFIYSSSKPGVTNLKVLTIPDSVVTIGDEAFEFCTGLTTLSIGEDSNLDRIGKYAFYYCEGLKEILIPASLTRLGSYAFGSCCGLTDVTYNAAECHTEGNRYEFRDSGADEGMDVVFGESVRLIDDSLFNDCNITDVVLPEGVTTLGSWAFGDCPKITSVTLPSTLVTIGSAPFNNATALRTVNYNVANLTSSISSAHTPFNASGAADPGITINIGSAVISIPDYLAYGVSNVNVVNMGANVTSIGYSAFAKTSIASITVPSKVTTLRSYAFQDCDLLATINYNAVDCETCGSAIFSCGQEAVQREVTFGDGVKTIPDKLFNGSFKLSSLDLGSGVQEIGEMAFYECTALTSLTIPASVTSLGRICFYGCSGVTSIVYSAAESTCGVNVFQGCGPESGIALTVSEGVLSIPDGLFQEAGRIKSVSLPSTLVEIGEDAFIGTAITALAIPDKVTTIGESAFNSTPITTLTIGKKVETIDRYAFFDCSELTSVTYNAIDCQSASSVFNTRDGFTSFTLTIGNQVETIPSQLFKDIDRVSGPIVIPDSVTTIGDSAFSRNTGIGAVTLGNGVATIVNSAFYECTGITSITFGTADLDIGQDAFRGCSGVTSLTVPANVKTLGRQVFNDMSGLTSINYNTNATGGGNLPIFNVVDEDCSVTFGDGVTSIPYSMFKGCSNLKTVNFNDDIEFIPAYAFHNCGNIGEIILPDSVTTIAAFAFVDCLGLETLVIPSSVTDIDSTAFTNVSLYDVNGTRLSYNAESLSGYKFTGSEGQLRMCNTGFHIVAEGIDALDDCIGIEGKVASVDEPVRAHYSFGGWFLNSQFTGDAYEITTYPDSLVTLYVKWIPDTYRVIFNSNGGSAVDYADVTYPSAVAEPDEPTRDGYDFSGWKLDDSTYVFSSIVLSDMTLVASWTPAEYEVTLDKNGGNEGGSATATYNSKPLSITAEPTRTGYVLTGYFTSAEGGEKVADRDGTLAEDVDNYTDGAGNWVRASTATLYAHWEPESYAVFLDKGTGDTDGSARVTYDTATLSSVVAPVKANYHVEGYYTSVNGGDKIANDDGTLVNGSVTGFVTDGKWKRTTDGTTLYAHWAADTYEITLDKNGGDTDGTAMATYGDKKLSSVVAPVTENYHVDGYYTSDELDVRVAEADGTLLADIDGYTDAEGNWIRASDTTLYALWDGDTFNITLDKNGGDADGSATAVYGWLNFSTFEPPTSAGFQPEGYYTAPMDGVKVINSLGVLIEDVEGYTDGDGNWIRASNTILYAIWEPAVYVVKLDKNGGDADGSAEVVFSSKPLSHISEPTRAGYHVTGYLTAADGVKVAESDGTLIADIDGFTDENGVWIRTSDQTVYATWEPNTYDIILVGPTENGLATVVFDTNNTSSFTAPKRTGYTPQSTYYADEGCTQPLLNEMGFVPSVDGFTDGDGNWIKASGYTLHAKWDAKVYQILLKANGGDSDIYVAVTFDSNVVDGDRVPVKPGNDIDGFYTQGNDPVLVINANLTLAVNVDGYTDMAGKWIRDESVVLDTHWEHHTYNVVLDRNGGDANGSATIVFDEKPLSSISEPTRTGYQVEGYYTSADLTTKVASAAGTLIAGVHEFTDGEGNWIVASDTTLYTKWSPLTYRVTFHAGHGTVDPAYMDIAFDSEYELPKATGYDGHYFSYWMDEDPIPTAGVWTIASDVGVTAVWADTPNWQISFYGGTGSTGNTLPISVVDGGTLTFPANGFEKTGHHFIGWSDGVNTYQPAATKENITADQQFDALWEPNTRKVTYKLDGVTLDGDYAPADHAYATAVTVLAKYTKTGYTVTEWEADGGVVISEGRFTMPDKNVTLSATSEVITYDVPLLMGDIGLSDGAATVDYFAKKLVISDAPVRPGYHVGGYCTYFSQYSVAEADGTLIADVDDSGPYTDEEGRWVRTGEYIIMSLYAQWVPDIYDLVLDKNEGDTDGAAKATYDSGTLDITTAPAKTGYVIDGYYSAADGVKVANANGHLLESVEGYTNDVGWWTKEEGCTLYAKWIPAVYDIFLDANGGTNNGSAKATYESKPLTEVVVPVKAYYHVSGYYTAASDGVKVAEVNGVLIASVDGFTDASGNWIETAGVTLYAHWEPDSYAVTIDSNGGTVGGAATATFASNTLVINEEPVRAGYSVTGYYTAASDGVKVAEADGTLVASVTGYTDGSGRWARASDVTLYAYWQGNTYRATYDASPGTVAKEYDDFVFGSEYTLPEPVYDAHYFSTWKNGTTPVAQSGIWNIDSDVTLTVEWTEQPSFQITFVGGEGATGTVAPIQVLQGGTLTFPANGFEKTGHTFAGWSDGANTYQPAATKENIIATAEYTALWTANVHKVTYKLDGVTLQDMYAPADISYGTAVTVLPVYVKTGYDVTAWEADGGVVISAGSFTMPDKDVILSATSTARHFDLTLSAGTSGSDGLAHVDYDAALDMDYDAVRYGYTLLGYTDSAGVMVIQSGALLPNVEGYTDADGKWKYDGAPQLTAKWQADKITLRIQYLFEDDSQAAPTYEKVMETDEAFSVNSPEVTGYKPDEKVIEGTIDPHYEPNLYTVRYSLKTFFITFDTQGGSQVDQAHFLYGEDVIAPADPTKEGYDFKGWDPALPAKMPAQNLTVKALWASRPAATNNETIAFVSDTDSVLIDTSSPATSSALSDGSKTVVEVIGDGWQMDIPKDIISGTTGNVSASAKVMDDSAKAALPDSVKARVEGKTVYSLSLSAAGSEIGFDGKKVKVSLPYVLKDGESASDVKVFCIKGDQLEEFDATYDADRKVAVFETEHFSDWFVDIVESPSGSGGGSNIGLIVGIIVGVLAVAAIVTVVVLVKTGKIGGKSDGKTA